MRREVAVPARLPRELVVVARGEEYFPVSARGLRHRARTVLGGVGRLSRARTTSRPGDASGDPVRAFIGIRQFDRSRERVAARPARRAVRATGMTRVEEDAETHAVGAEVPQRPEIVVDDEATGAAEIDRAERTVGFAFALVGSEVGRARAVPRILHRHDVAGLSLGDEPEDRTDDLLARRLGVREECRLELGLGEHVAPRSGIRHGAAQAIRGLGVLVDADAESALRATEGARGVRRRGRYGG